MIGSFKKIIIKTIKGGQLLFVYLCMAKHIGVYLLPDLKNGQCHVCRNYSAKRKRRQDKR